MRLVVSLCPDVSSYWCEWWGTGNLYKPGWSWFTFQINIVIQRDSFDELHLILSKWIIAFVFAGFVVPLRCNKVFVSVVVPSLLHLHLDLDCCFPVTCEKELRMWFSPYFRLILPSRFIVTQLCKCAGIHADSTRIQRDFCLFLRDVLSNIHLGHGFLMPVCWCLTSVNAGLKFMFRLVIRRSGFCQQPVAHDFWKLRSASISWMMEFCSAVSVVVSCNPRTSCWSPTVVTA